MTYHVTITEKNWLLRKPFKISRDTHTHAETIVCTISDGEYTGRGEAAGVPYKGETIASIRAGIEGAIGTIRGGVTREELQTAMPPGGARNAVDCALWDLEAKRAGKSIWQMLGWQPHDVTTVYTVGIETPERMRQDAAVHADFPILKVKVGIGDPLEQISAIREGAPDCAIVIDANQAWTVADLSRYSQGLEALGVEMIEQPLPANDDEALRGYESSIPLCADESCDSRADLDRLAGLYDLVNIKLDKTGGLTEAVALALQCEAMGFGLMVGNMLGSSLAMAPAFVIAQRCKYVDIDGPLLQAEDCDHALRYDRGQVAVFSSALWG